MIERLDNFTDERLARIGSENKGKRILVVVHPFWSGNNPKFENFVKTKRYLKSLIILFERSTSIQKTKEKLISLGVKSNEPVFLVSTKEKTSTPIMGWQKFFAKFDVLGAKKIIVAGRSLAPGDLNYMKAWLANEKILKPRNRQKYIYDALRTTIRAAKITGQKENAWQHCAGFAWAKIAARNKWQVNVMRKF